MAAITVDLISTSSAQAVHSFLSRLEQRKVDPRHCSGLSVEGLLL